MQKDIKDCSAMLDVTERAVDGNMCIENKVKVKRPSILSMKFRLREERKKVIRMSKAKYHTIEDHEVGMRRFCLIRNTLQRLKRDAREEKLARHSSIGKHVTPSYLSASAPKCPSPPREMETDEVLRTYGQPTPSPITAFEDEDELPPSKRRRVVISDNKENENENFCEDQLIDVVGDRDESCAVDKAQDILRDAYESYTGESITQTLPSCQPVPIQPDLPYNSTICDSTTNLDSNDSSSQTSNLSCSSNLHTCSTSPDNVECMEKSKPHQQYPCSQSALMGSDLKSVVYHSLVTSL